MARKSAARQMYRYRDAQGLEVPLLVPRWCRCSSLVYGKIMIHWCEISRGDGEDTSYFVIWPQRKFWTSEVVNDRALERTRG